MFIWESHFITARRKRKKNSEDALINFLLHFTLLFVLIVSSSVYLIFIKLIVFMRSERLLEEGKKFPKLVFVTRAYVFVAEE